ncbi:hypothetical protein M5X11_28120 [Paenibacillus alginolyticus]|uniref:hypothetical protein n=1 Tax=Paenibacillus alginolyticus TaxID=59839 RepID=UPI0004242A8A|nr:hypothetical protein [Paenibacillus alginolyticus]MCY9668745.1 hypothetical protein [Paenibacillus alginolyticus]
MTHCPDWILPAIQKRFDELDLFVQKELQIQHNRAESDNYLEQLKATLSVEQLGLLNQWDDYLQMYLAKEKELLYRHGLADGIHVVASVFQIPAPVPLL